MSAWDKSKLDNLLQGLVNSEECALVHEAALMSWGLDNNLVPYAVDVLASKIAFTLLAEQAQKKVLEHRGNKYIQSDENYIPVRIWLSVGDGVTYSPERIIECARVHYRCLRPEFVLEALPSSPDFQYLLEQRAALAEVLYFDDMTDEQLMEFRAFVRCV